MLNPKFARTNTPLGQAYIQKKLYSKAIEAFSKLPMTTFDLGSNGLIYIAFTYAASGNLSAAKSFFNKVSKEDLDTAPYVAACYYAQVGDIDNALSQIEHAYQIHNLPMIHIKHEPLLDPLRNEPRFKAVLRKMNLD